MLKGKCKVLRKYKGLCVWRNLERFFGEGLVIFLGKESYVCKGFVLGNTSNWFYYSLGYVKGVIREWDVVRNGCWG